MDAREQLKALIEKYIQYKKEKKTMWISLRTRMLHFKSGLMDGRRGYHVHF